MVRIVLWSATALDLVRKFAIKIQRLQDRTYSIILDRQYGHNVMSLIGVMMDSTCLGDRCADESGHQAVNY